MSKYTTEVRFICESYAGLSESTGQKSVNNIIKQAIPKVFDFDFPIFDEAYREVLCGKILKHYYLREIGLETVGAWKLMLDTKLNEIMPYYNQLYNSEKIKIDPMNDYKLTKNYNKTKNESKNGNSQTESSGSNKAAQNSSNNGTDYNLYSDTPQGALTGVDTQEYLTNARKVTNTDTTTASSTGESDYHEQKTNVDTLNSTDTYIEELSGKIGVKSYSELLKEFRNTFLNIDMMIINELSDLFFGLY